MTCATVSPVSRSTGVLRLAGRSLRCTLGEAGVTRHKQEGDRATPCGVLALRRILYRADRITLPVLPRLPHEPIAPDDGWCDDSNHADYNRAVHLPHPGRHERLWRADRLYDLIAVLGHNDDPVRKAEGSAIFLHVASPDERPTAGCVAMHLEDLRWALAAGLSAMDIECG